MFYFLYFVALDFFFVCSDVKFPECVLTEKGHTSGRMQLQYSAEPSDSAGTLTWHTDEKSRDKTGSLPNHLMLKNKQ